MLGLPIMMKKIGQGSEKAKLYLKEHPEVFQEIDHKVRKHFGLIDEATAADKSNENPAAKGTKDKAKVSEPELVSLELDTIEIEE